MHRAARWDHTVAAPSSGSMPSLGAATRRRYTARSLRADPTIMSLRPWGRVDGRPDRGGSTSYGMGRGPRLSRVPPSGRRRRRGGTGVDCPLIGDRLAQPRPPMQHLGGQLTDTAFRAARTPPQSRDGQRSVLAAVVSTANRQVITSSRAKKRCDSPRGSNTRGVVAGAAAELEHLADRTARRGSYRRRAPPPRHIRMAAI
jgi:hypothetical protein